MNDLTRRQMLQRSGFALFGATLPSVVGAAEPTRTGNRARPSAGGDGEDAGDTVAPSDTKGLARQNRSPRSVQEYYVRRVRETMREADARRAAMRTRADAERYVADVRERLRQCYGPMPEKMPLKPRVMKTLERDGYRIENVIYESRPGFPVTANLFVPSKLKAPAPGVMVPVGHFSSGKVGSSSIAQALAKLGYVALAFDPIGQGERVQYVDDHFKAIVGAGTSEHTYSGVRMPLVGENLPTWFMWDCVRSLDYLLSRPEVDSRHIGMTGSSGGGNQTMQLSGFDFRLTMAAPSCNVTSLRRNVENEHSQDPEQWPWGLLARGLDHSDFLAAMAPRPVLLVGQEGDYFDARGFEEACRRLRRLYSLLGAEENFSFYLGEGGHGFAKPNREAMYRWFNHHSGMPKVEKEPDLVRENWEELRCLPHGQVAELKPMTEFSYTSELSRKLRKSRPALSGDVLKKRISAILKLPAREGVCEFRIMRQPHPRGYPKRSQGEYLLETEPDVHVYAYRLNDTPLQSRPPRGPKRAVLYVAHQSADEELRSDPWLKELAASEPDAAFYACDVRGVGESRPVLSTPANPKKGGADYLHAGFGLLFDYPTAGQRTHDVLSVLDWMASYGHEDVHLVARGWGAIPGTFAGVLHDLVKQVTLKHALTSYADVAESERYQWPLATFVPGVLKAFDLPDCYRELERKKLRQIEPASPAGVPA
ncbi:MAG: acetylxylan esterase [Opitutaceae bacterium]|nr:acetylxylan esterase [Opitutaceae bacterium]